METIPDLTYSPSYLKTAIFDTLRQNLKETRALSICTYCLPINCDF